MTILTSAKNNINLRNAIQQLTLFVSMGLGTTALTSCGGGDQDRGIAATQTQTFSGVAVDGHIARATVFIDSNNNGTRDAWEPFAFTDDDGYYSRNPNTGDDYCAGDANAEEQQYCLRTTSQFSNIVLRIDGGYDRLTGEPFLAQLSRRINAADISQTVNTVISPITTLVTSPQDANTQNTILANIGLTLNDLNIDYLNAYGNSEVDAHLLNTALKIHKTVTVLSDRLDDNYTQMQGETGMPNSASLAVYQSLANEIGRNKATHINATLTNPAQLLSVIDNAEEKIRAIYTQRNMDLPLDMGNTSNPERLERAVNVAVQIPPVVDRLLNELDVAMDKGQVLGNARALEALVIKTTQEGYYNDPSVDNAFRFFLDANNDSLLETLRLALSDDQADINSLANNAFNPIEFNNADAITATARMRNDSSPFSSLQGKRLKISDLDLGFAPNNLKDIEIEINFLANPNATTVSTTSGGFIACAKYIEDASKARIGEGNFKGEIVSGYWSLLGATADKASSYSLLLTFDFLDANYQAIMKPAGTATINGVKYQQIRFDNNGDIGLWHSQDGFTEQTTIPSTSADCRSRLPTRIGI